MHRVLAWLQKPDRLASRLSRIYMLILGCMLGLLSIASIGFVYGGVRNALSNSLQGEARMLASSMQQAIERADHTRATELLANLVLQPDIVRATVTSPDGRVIADFESPAAAGSITIGGRAPSLTHEIIEQPIMVDDHPRATLTMTASLDGLNRLILTLALVTVLIGGLALRLSNRAFNHLAGIATAPLEALATLMQHIEKGQDEHVRLDTEGSDEVGKLIRVFNKMLDVTQARRQALKTELEERKHLQVMLDKLAHFDQVTGLPNRNFFRLRLDESIERAQIRQMSMAVMFIDLDNFKLINDSYGHHVGDGLLRAAGERLASSLRQSDIVARLGGDEFAVVLNGNFNLAQLGAIADKLISALTQPLTLDGNKLHISGSIGIAGYPQDAGDSNMLLQCADAAMYVAKNAGKNAWRCYEPYMTSNSRERLELEREIRAGLDNGEFELHYQPQIDLGAGYLHGFEGLARWRHPQRGMISPASFIPIAEESGLIIKLGEWALRQACETIARWNRQHDTQYRMAVNVSPKELARPDYLDYVQSVLADSGCAPQWLEIEITESLLMTHGERALTLLSALRTLGITISIDDFGTGYSSLGRLRDLPIDKLKIDKRFVDDLSDDLCGLAIIRSITTLAESLRLGVVAEGVEHDHQAQLLRGVGCHCFQGFYFSRPLAASDTEQFIRTQARPGAPAPTIAETPPMATRKTTPGAAAHPQAAPATH